MTAIMPDADEMLGEDEPSLVAPRADPALPAAEPLFRVVKGNPTDEELAAIVMVLSGLAATQKPSARANAGVDAWGRPALLLRPAVAFSPDSFAFGW
jgi:hypothetical protein